MVSSWLRNTGQRGHRRWRGGEEEAREQIGFDSALGVLFAVYVAEFRKRHVKG